MISVSSTSFGGNDTTTAYILIDVPIADVSPNDPWNECVYRHGWTNCYWGKPPSAHVTAEAVVKVFGTM